MVNDVVSVIVPTLAVKQSLGSNVVLGEGSPKKLLPSPVSDVLEILGKNSQTYFGFSVSCSACMMQIVLLK